MLHMINVLRVLPRYNTCLHDTCIFKPTALHVGYSVGTCTCTVFQHTLRYIDMMKKENLHGMHSEEVTFSLDFFSFPGDLYMYV